MHPCEGSERSPTFVVWKEALNSAQQSTTKSYASQTRVTSDSSTPTKNAGKNKGKDTDAKKDAKKKDENEGPQNSGGASVGKIVNLMGIALKNVVGSGDGTLPTCSLLFYLYKDLTEIGSKGASLSGGQKVRVALARAVYARTQYLIILFFVPSYIIGRQILAPKREGNNVFPIVQATATTAHLMSFSAILSEPSKLLIQSHGKPSKSDSNLDSLMEEIEDSCPVTPEPVTEQTSTKVSKQTSLLSFFAPSSSKKQSHPKPTPPPSPQKKKAKVTAICMNSEDSKHIAGLSGISRSSVKARELNQKDQLRSLEIDPLKWKRFQVKILEVDPHAEFHPTARRQVQCSGCGEWTMGQTVYSAVRFLKHVKENCKHHGKAADKSLPEIQNPRVELPCPGLTAEVHTQIKTYLERSGAKGGGASSLKALSASLFSATWDSLNKLQRKSVETAYMHGLTWLNDHEAKCVYARDCKKIIKIVEGTPLQPCEQCTGLLENIIYNNKKYQNNELLNLSLEFKGLQVLLDYKDRHNLPLPLRFAKLAATGTFDDKEPFIGLLHAMTLTAEHAAKGISLQNMKYHPAFDDFCSVLALQSPAEYQIFRAQLGGRTQRSQHAKAALEPRFPIGITESTFDRALDYIQKVRYDGPLALSCDDTKLLPAYRMYYCKKSEKWFLLGTVGEPLAVADPDELQKVLENSAPQKATKLRLWCLQIPMPGIAPLILAAKAIPNDLDATDLLEYTWKILQGCWKLNLYIISYSCDGTEVERLVQRKIGEKADYMKHYTIKHPGLGYDEITVNIYMFQGCPLTIIQDSNHCAKTFRNNLFTGAQLLTLGSYTASYDTIRRAAFMDGNPLYIRDVEKLDRQDDNAAARLFSAPMLEFLIQHFPEKKGDIVYLFIGGEIVDAYQNRHIPHIERIQMVLMGLFFLDIWDGYLKAAGYATSKHFISREANNILRILIHGLIGLIIIHLNHSPGPNRYPLLPWLHSTETCEHVFGQLRQYVKDFTYLDAIYLIPKLSVPLRAAYLSTLSDERATASGYKHKYFQHKDIDLPTLSTFPSDQEIAEATSRAWIDAKSLFMHLGVPLDLFALQQQQPTRLHPEGDEYEFEGIGTEEIELDPEALIEDALRIHHSLQEVEAIEPERVLSLNYVSSTSLNLSSLVQRRLIHQTNHAAKSVCQNISSSAASGENGEASPESPPQQITSIRRNIIHQFHQILKVDQVQGVTTSIPRQVRWKGAAAVFATGNAANAAAVAEINASNNLQRRRKIWVDVKIPCPGELTTAMISTFQSLVADDFGIVLWNERLMLGKVLHFYEKGRGKNATHAWAGESSNIGQISYISVQLYEHFYGATFSETPLEFTKLYAKGFAHLHSHSFLYRIPSNSNPQQSGNVFILPNSNEVQFWQTLSHSLLSIKKGVKLLTSRPKKS
ncbi:hypothetical protein M422DRAFT_270465 [Sphaerobolus stellatus SS14]|uniref:Uncharacterized protein n=1 Tax=Sphaerobolus stellatus (strain SS14) TaxID=990650 RepID=A0A0C9USN2_SPHS4|nr:hypothetical protein M422DRAFT_270465 [Sphaerobolus stellatus SS14]